MVPAILWQTIFMVRKVTCLCYILLISLQLLHVECENYPEHSLMASGESRESTLWTSFARWVEGVCKGQLKFLSMYCANVCYFSGTTSCKLYNRSVGLTSFHLPEDAQGAFSLLLLFFFLNLIENRGALKPLSSYIGLNHLENLQGFSFVCF